MGGAQGFGLGGRHTRGAVRGAQAVFAFSTCADNIGPASSVTLRGTRLCGLSGRT